MAETQKFLGELITFKGARAAFAHLHKAQARTDKKTGLPKGEPKFRLEVLLDPTNKEHAQTIAKIKSESVRALNHRYPAAPDEAPRFDVALLEAVASGKRALANFHLCWGYGNDLPALGKKLYDGYKDMFFLKLTDKNRPNLGAVRNGKTVNVVEGDKDCPYAGSYVAGTTTLYSYDNESRGVNANLRTIVFVRPGAAFGGGQADAESEYAALGDLGAGDAGSAAGDPFGAAGAAADPFAIG